MDNSLVVLLTLFGAIGGLGGTASALATWYQRRRFTAEARKIGIEGDVLISDRAIQLYEIARARAEKAEAVAENCRVRMIALEDHVSLLNGILRQAGLSPPPFQPPSPIVAIVRKEPG